MLLFGEFYRDQNQQNKISLITDKIWTDLGSFLADASCSGELSQKGEFACTATTLMTI